MREGEGSPGLLRKETIELWDHYGDGGHVSWVPRGADNPQEGGSDLSQL